MQVVKKERVAFTVTDVRGELVYITAEGLQSASDSLTRKRQRFLISEFHRLPNILKHSVFGRQVLLAAIVKCNRSAQCHCERFSLALA